MDEALERDGIFPVSADDLKRHGGREPRLMAKIDTLAERPAALAERALALFPVRNGRYVLFPDPEQKSFYRFDGYADPGPVRIHRSRADLEAFDTFPRGREASESQALDFAHLAGLLGAFCGDADMRLTLRGRFFSGDFAFATPLRGLRVEVGGVQVEVDAGYEGEGIHLVEAKRGRREDFHIRQLWYPWLHWKARTRKRVRPVFFAYSNGQYFLSEFAFGERFGELEPVRNRAYLLDESPLAELDLKRLLADAPPAAEPAGPFPQANDLDKVVDLVQIAAAGEGLSKEGIAETFGMDERQGDYYGNAACFLGLLERGEAGYGATDAGRRFALLRTRAGRTAALIDRMLSVPALREFLALLVARDYRVEKIAPGEMADVIRRTSGLSASTPSRRASTVRAWLTWVMANIKVRA